MIKIGKKKYYTNDKEDNLIFELTKNHGKRRKQGIINKLKKLGVKNIDQRVAKVEKTKDYWWN